MVGPHPLEIDQTEEGTEETRQAVPSTEQVRVHHRAKRDVPLIIAKGDGKERERNHHFKTETCMITTLDLTTGKRTLEEREVGRESMETALLPLPLLPVLGRPNRPPRRD